VTLASWSDNLSRDFAQLVLQQYYSGVAPSLFDREALHSQNVVELGYVICHSLEWRVFI